jgi:UDP-N-acetylglucosamine 2-epimerase (non-hydrolysing)
VGTTREAVFKETRLLLEDTARYRRMAEAVNPYGDGRASRRICQALLYCFGLGDKPPEPFK